MAFLIQGVVCGLGFFDYYYYCNCSGRRLKVSSVLVVASSH